MANFSLATNETWVDKQGEKKERVEWHSIVAWGKLAELCSTYLSKGRQVYIEGKIQTRTWEKDGEKKYKTEIVARQVTFLGGKSEEKPKPKSEEKPKPKSEDAGGEYADFGPVPSLGGDDVLF